MAGRLVLSIALRSSRSNKLDFWALLEPLERASLVERLPVGAFKMHRLTQEVVKAQLSDKLQSDWAEWVIRALNATYPRSPLEDGLKLCEKLQPHARVASELARKYKLVSTEAGELFARAGCFAEKCGDHPGAKLFFEHSLEVQENLLGSKHPETTKATWSLLETVRTLNDRDAEARLIDKLRWLLDSSEVSRLSADQRSIRQRLFTLRSRT